MSQKTLYETEKNLLSIKLDAQGDHSRLKTINDVANIKKYGLSQQMVVEEVDFEVLSSKLGDLKSSEHSNESRKIKLMNNEFALNNLSKSFQF